MNAPSLAKVGSVCLLRIQYPRGYWSDPAVPEYAPNWVVGLRLPGRKQQRQSAKHPICATCLAVEGSPSAVRPDCRCQVPARKFAEAWLVRERVGWMEGRTEALKTGLRRPKSVVMLGKVFALYAEHGPQESGRQAREAQLLLEQATGLRLEEMTIELLQDKPRDLILRWAAMRQVYAERGWTMRDYGHGRAPADAWPRLRAEWAAGEIQRVPDRVTVRAVNTTIMGHLASLKSIFSKVSRTNYLPGLELPGLPKLEEVELALPRPKGFRPISAERYRAMHEALEALRGEDLRLWTALNLAACMGPRTKELKAVKPHWLEVVTRPARAFTLWTDEPPVVRDDAMVYGTFVILKNRPEEGFALKARHRAVVRRILLPQHVVEALGKVATADSLFGLTEWQTEKLIRRGSEWLRQFITTGPQTWYWLRKLAGAIKYTAGQTRDAGALLGHAPGSTVTADTYVELLGSVRSVSLAQLHPDQVRMAG